jgi:hypothetical protein
MRQAAAAVLFLLLAAMTFMAPASVREAPDLGQFLHWLEWSAPFVLAWVGWVALVDRWFGQFTP